MAGATFWASTGTDLDAALVDGTVGPYLADAVEHRSALGVNLTLWMCGVGLPGLGGVLVAGSGRDLDQPARDVARVCHVASATLALSRS